MDLLLHLWHLTGFPHLTWQMPVMWGVVLILFYLAIYKGFEPLLLIPIAFGALLANLPTQGILSPPPGDILAPVSGLVLDVSKANRDEVTHGDLLFRIQFQQQSDHGLVTQIREVRAGVNGRLVDIKFKPGDTVLEGETLGRILSKEPGGLFYYIYKGIEWEIFPPLIFLGVGALTDFGPLIANPRTMLLGAAAQLGVFITFLGAAWLGFGHGACAAMSIIGGADGPTAIFLASSLAPDLLSPIAVAAYSYMALVPLIQPPIMRALTTEKERKIRMKSLRPVGRLEKLTFCLLVTIACILLVPAASALIGMLMLGNFLRECTVTERLVKAAQNEIINIITIFLGTSVGITMTGQRFLQAETLKIIALGVVAFGFSTAGGVLMAKLMNLFSRANPINPLIGSAGVSAVPMAARVSHLEGQRADPNNYLLMHAMGPNVAGVIGTAVVAGYFLATLGK
jgi:oxaloacetate decarboxylase beta subunit